MAEEAVFEHAAAEEIEEHEETVVELEKTVEELA